jgi:hypothetical protein
MEQSQYCHFPGHAREGGEATMMPAGDRDHTGCFTDQVKLTQALVRDLDEAMKRSQARRSQSWRPYARG